MKILYLIHSVDYKNIVDFLVVLYIDILSYTLYIFKLHFGFVQCIIIYLSVVTTDFDLCSTYFTLDL